MADAILDGLGPVLTRWTMGGSALAVMPEQWRETGASDDTESELRLLALSGHYLATLVVPEPRRPLRMRADLPQLAKPPLPAALRPRACRLLDQAKEQKQRRDLLAFVDARGWTFHPGDFLPAAGDDVPAVYAPWQDWAAGNAAAAPDQAIVLSGTNWATFAPAALLSAFAELRRQDPGTARELLAERFASEGADARVRLLASLETALDDDDAGFLESLASDRAPRVRALAAMMLARLGRVDAPGEDAAELAAFFPLQTKGLLRRSLAVAPTPLKTPAQAVRRSALLESVPFDAFIAALGLDGEAFMAAWSWGSDTSADSGLARMVASSAGDVWVQRIFAAMSGEPRVDSAALEALAPRLSRQQRVAAAEAQLGRRHSDYPQARRLGGVGAELPHPIRSYAGQALLAALSHADARPATGAEGLFALGLISSQSGAREALEAITAAGLSAADPRLDMLRLNAALDHRGTIE